MSSDPKSPISGREAGVLAVLFLVALLLWSPALVRAAAGQIIVNTPPNLFDGFIVVGMILGAVVAAFSFFLATTILRRSGVLDGLLIGESPRYLGLPSLTPARVSEMVARALKERRADLGTFTAKERSEALDRVVAGAIAELRESQSVSLLAKLHGERSGNIETQSLERLGQHVVALGSRANFALVAGMGFAATGAVTLGIIVLFERPIVDPSLMDVAVRYLPRVSIVLIVELVAFFFLRTYARTLADIRYVQNELTNVEMKLIGLHAAQGMKATDVAKKALLALVQTERNHILEKGQTSLENERERLDNEGFMGGLNAAAAIFHGPTANAKSAASTKTRTARVAPKAEA